MISSSDSELKEFYLREFHIYKLIDFIHQHIKYAKNNKLTSEQEINSWTKILLAAQEALESKQFKMGHY